MKPETKPGVGSLVLSVLFIAAALGRCEHASTYQPRPCGPLHPVTIGGMVIGCQ